MRDEGEPRGPRTTAREDPIGALLRVAGRRPTAPREVVDRVFAATHEEWRQMVLRRRRRTGVWSVLGSLAAGIAVVLWIGSLAEEPREPAAGGSPVRAAAVDVVLGDTTRLYGPDRTAPATPLTTADVVFTGSSIATGASGGVALRLEDGGSLRLDSSTWVRFLGVDDIELRRGVLYLDGGLGGVSKVAVHTELGVVRERGTQFEVRVLADEIRVRVREGAVLVERDEPVSAAAGVELRIGRHGGVSRRSISAFDESWSWILDLAPSFPLTRRTLGEFLGWIERETGKQVAFASPAEAERLSAIVLYGSVDGLRPGEALDAVLPTCGLAAVESGHTIEIR